MKYRILHLDLSKRSKLFMSWDILNECCGGFDIQDYHEVYAGDLQTDTKDKTLILEELFQKFNLNHPEDFHGHSMSVSDVVILDNEIYFCDSLGWKKIV